MTPPTEVKAAVERAERYAAALKRNPFDTRACLETDDLRTVLQALAQATEENEREHRVCDGCGSSWSEVALKAKGKISCCPERKMLTAKEWSDRATKAEAERDEALEALSALLERCRAHGGLSRQGYAERKAMDDAAALLSRSAQGGEHG